MKAMKYDEAATMPSVLLPHRQADGGAVVKPPRATLSLVAANTQLTDEERKAMSAEARRPNGKRRKSYLLKAAYRQVSQAELSSVSAEDMHAALEAIRWGDLDAGQTRCPRCDTVAEHYRCPSIQGWKCKTCRKQFSLFSGTTLHSTKMSAKELVHLYFRFVEAKDSISARELTGVENHSHKAMHVLMMKTREAIGISLSAEPKLTGRVQTDAAYFIKYVRPGNVGTGAALSARAEQKLAGQVEPADPHAKVERRVSENMRALVVFAQAGPQKTRQYRVAMVKTENRVDIDTLAPFFCEPTARLASDHHSAYTGLGFHFDSHDVVNHSKQFLAKDGTHTNLAENYFSRVRACAAGAWHRMSVQHLVEYGWEAAWRLTMVGHSNLEQLEDLLVRVLRSGRPRKFADYWKKREESKRAAKLPRDEGYLVEVPAHQVPRKRGRPSGAKPELL